MTRRVLGAMTGGDRPGWLCLAALALALGCGDPDEQARAGDCATDTSAAALADSACIPAVVAGEPAAPPAPPDESLRPAITAMLGALLDSTVPRPRPDSLTPLVAPVARVTVATPLPAAPQLVCIAPEPLPRRDAPYDARLRFLADPDSAMLAQLARPGMLLFHPRRCPPTLETTTRATSLRRPPGEDPTLLSVRDVAEGEGGALYADVVVARGARGWFWVCAVMEDDLSTVRCTASERTWTQ